MNLYLLITLIVVAVLSIIGSVAYYESGYETVGKIDGGEAIVSNVFGEHTEPAFLIVQEHQRNGYVRAYVETASGQTKSVGQSYAERAYEELTG